MQDTRLRMSARQRRRQLIQFGIATAVVCVPLWFVAWAAALVVLCLWLPGLLYGLSIMFGSTTLTAEGLRLRTLFSCRLIPWTEVISIKEDKREDRGARYSVVVLRRSQGKDLLLPGVRRGNVRKRNQEEERRDFDERLTAIFRCQRQWQQRVQPN